MKTATLKEMYSMHKRGGRGGATGHHDCAHCAGEGAPRLVLRLPPQDAEAHNLPSLIHFQNGVFVTSELRTR
jgi:hypothetical protein